MANMEVSSEPPTIVTFYAPEGLRNGREVGAWAYGVACGLSGSPALVDPAGYEALHVCVKSDHVDGAVTAIVGAGGGVRRAYPGEYVHPASEGFVTLVVSLGV